MFCCKFQLLNWNYCNPKLTRRNISTVKTWRFSHCQTSTISDTAKTLRSRKCPSTGCGFPNITPAHHAVPWHLDHWNHRLWSAPAQKATKEWRPSHCRMADKCMTQEKHQTSNNSTWRCNLVLSFDSPLAVPSSMAWFGMVQHFWALPRSLKYIDLDGGFAWFCLCHWIAIFQLMMLGVVLQLPLLLLIGNQNESKTLKTCWNHVRCYVMCIASSKFPTVQRENN